jgi:photosystem II stability/assembly factor-like uncharacterized protein
MNKIKLYLKNPVIFIIIIFASSSSLYSQWIQLNSGVSTQFISVCFVNQATGFVCGAEGKVLKTTNGGINWQSNTVLDSATLTSVFFANSNTGFIAGRILIIASPLIAKPVLLKTTNSGDTWADILIDSGYTLWSVCFLNESSGFAAGGLYASGPNKLLSTTNGGTNWQIDSFQQPGYLFTVSFNDVSTGFAVGFGGYVYRTTNSGLVWNTLSFIPNLLVSITFLNPVLGFSTGFNLLDSSGYIFKTSNGGNNWELIYSDTLGMLNEIKFVNSSTGFAIGHCEGLIYSLSARIIKTTNSGVNWFLDTLFGNIGGLSSLFFTDQSTGYAVGSNGAIFKTTNGGNPIGIVPKSKEIPETFNLSQNYPNPFNPKSNIKFQIAKLSEVKLLIFDVLGREITTLVNEPLQPGTYEAEWDGTNYSSGLYFYKLITAEYSETRKMVLVK